MNVLRMVSSGQMARQALSYVIEKRVEEIYLCVRNVIRDTGYEEVLSSGIVITGGSALMRSPRPTHFSSSITSAR